MILASDANSDIQWGISVLFQGEFPMVKSKSPSARPCERGLWRYRQGQSEVSTGCNRQVSGSRRFAQGHDAVLKSLFIRAGIAGADVVRTDGRTFGPTSAAEQYGFGHQVSAGIAKGCAKAGAVAARQLKAAAARQAKAADAPAARALEVKVGRWSYPVVGELDGRLTYADKSGETRMAPKGAQTRSV
jgi:hypothetical protein